MYYLTYWLPGLLYYSTSLPNDTLTSAFNCRIDKLDFALRSLQAQHQVAENENLKRSNLLEQTTSALSLLESENTRLKKVSTNSAYSFKVKTKRTTNGQN